MRQFRFFRLLGTLASVAALGAYPANAGVITLTFTGTYVTIPGPVFGETGPLVPFSYQLTYDTSLNSFPRFIPSGTNVINSACPASVCTTTHPWFGYYKSGIISSSLTFGTHTWTDANVINQIPVGPTLPDYLWFDADIDLSAPTLASIRFIDVSGELQLGRVITDGGNVFLAPLSKVIDNQFGFTAESPINLPMVISWTRISDSSSVPEPSALALFGFGVLGLGVFRRRRHRVTV